MTGLRPCIYFSRLTVDEERALCASQEKVLERMLAVMKTTPRFQLLRSAFAEQIQRDPFDLKSQYTSPTEIMTNRLQQMALFLAIGYFLEDLLGTGPSCVSFYSSGVQPAVVYTGCVSIDDYFSHILPLVRENRVRIEEAGRRHALVECLLVGAEDDKVEAFVQRTIVEAGYSGRVFIKDVRGQHAILVAGFHDEVARVRSHTSDAFASVAARERRIHQTDGAHIPLYERAAFDSLLAWGGMSSPRVPIVGTCGELLLNGDSGRVVSILSDAISGPMDTHRTLREVRKLSNFIAVVGSELGAKVLRSPSRLPENGWHDGGGVKLATDVIAVSLLDRHLVG
jgi:hypothetical protein